MRCLISFILLHLVWHISAQEPRIPYLKNGSWGFADSSAQIIVEPKYISVNRFSHNGTALVTVETDRGYKRGLIDKEGNTLVDPKYDLCESLGEGYYSVAKGGSRALFKGNEALTKFKYKRIKKIKGHELIAAEIKHSEDGFGKYWGLLAIENNELQLIIQHKYSVVNFDPELRIVYAITVKDPENTCEYYDLNGDRVLEEEFPAAPQVEQELEPIPNHRSEKELQGMKVRNESVQIMQKEFDKWVGDYDQVVAFGALNRYIVKKDNKFGLINALEETLLDIEYDEISQMRPESKFLFIKKGDMKTAMDGNLLELIFPWGAYNLFGGSTFFDGFEVFHVFADRNYGGTRTIYIAPDGTQFYELEKDQID